jgi:hypothetical protein
MLFGVISVSSMLIQYNLLFFYYPGTLLVNDEFAYSGIAPGQHEGLELGAPLYLGSVPDFRRIPRSAGFSEGLVGRLHELIYFSGALSRLSQEL